MTFVVMAPEHPLVDKITTSEYKNAVAKMDEASLIFQEENLEIYNEVYNSLREYAWNMYSVSGGDAKPVLQQNLSEPLTVSSMVELALNNSTVFDHYKSTSRQKNERLIAVLNSEKYFSAPLDPMDLELSSEEITKSEFISRRCCARFLWNTYVKNQGEMSLLTKYSTRYNATGRTKSPVADVSVSNIDFDAVLGVIENEIMDLPDGKHFFPNKIVTKLDFLKWIKSIEK